MRRTPLIAFTIALLVVASTSRGDNPRTLLNRSLPDLNFTGVTLADAIEFLRDVSGANIHVNWQALEATGVGRDATVNLRMRNIPLRKVLQLVLREAGGGDLLTYYIDDEVIEVTTKEISDEQMFTRIYPVDDLIMEVPDFDNAPDFSLQGSSTGGGGGGGGGLFGGGVGGDEGTGAMTRAERAAQLIEMIQAIIEPDLWDVNGGRAAIRFFNGSLVVTAPRSIHEALGGYVD